MPAILLHGAALPVTVPPFDSRLQRRSIPPELQSFERDNTPLGLALRRLAKEIFQPPVGLVEREEEFKRRAAEAINQTAQAAFTPTTTISYLTATQAIGAVGFTALTGMAQSIVVPVPARVHLILNLVALVPTPSDFLLDTRVLTGATALCTGQACMPAAGVANFQWSLTSQDLFDVEPETLYTFTPQAQVSAVGPVYRFVTGAANNLCTFTVRVEPRSLVKE